MILTDGTHLVSDTSLEELHSFARRIGLRREWFQSRTSCGFGGKRIPHYDIFGKVALRAGEAGIHVVPIRELVKRAVRR